MDGSNLCLITFHASVRLPAAISVEKRFFLPSAPFPNARTSLNAARERIFTPPHRNMCASIRTIVCNNINTIATGLKAFIYHVQSTPEIMAHCSPLYFPWLLPHTHTHSLFWPCRGCDAHRCVEFFARKRILWIYTVIRHFNDNPV